MKILCLFFVTVLWLATNAGAFACSRDAVRIQINMAAFYFQQASHSGLVEQKQTAARHAQRAIEEAETALISCHCYIAASDINDAAMHLRAVWEYDPNEISIFIQRSFRAFSLGVDQIKVGLCG